MTVNEWVTMNEWVTVNELTIEWVNDSEW